MIIPFINFAGQANDAIAFYEQAFDVRDKKVMFFKEMPVKPDFPITPEMENYVLHAQMTINGTEVWMGDSPVGITPGNMVSLAVSFTSQPEARKAFDQLKTGGKVLMELAPQFYSPLYGMLEDKFGVVWHIICQ